MGTELQEVSIFNIFVDDFSNRLRKKMTKTPQ